jgi:23S rRNA U2552 (ribose-2'-O)-methylase RlmE/FtsJ
VASKFGSTTLFQRHRLSGSPFEGIGKSVFTNRAAVKLANLDSLFSLTTQPAEDAVARDAGRPPLIFVDLCGAPGGWSEYLLWKVPSAEGYALSLSTERGGLSWNVSSPRLHVSRDGDGDILSDGDRFATAFVPRAADLVVADGGTDNAPGREDRQEQDGQRLFIAETATALKCLALGGSYVLKLFDCVTLPTIELMYLLSLCFQETHLIKPMTSRPANSERYLVCKGYRESAAASLLVDLDMQPASILYTRLLPPSTIDPTFLAYVEGAVAASLSWQRQHCDIIYDAMRMSSTSTPVKAPNRVSYDLDRALTFMGLPWIGETA